jgi:hypothetical protein
MKIIFIIFLILKYINCKNLLINQDEIVFKINNNNIKGEYYAIEKISHRKTKLPKINNYINICK